MAWTAPRTWVVGETPTAAIFNAHVRDNLLFLYGAPSCRVYNNAAISIPNAADTALTFNTERFDNDTMHSTVSNTGRITTTTAGRYLVVANDEFVANATGVRWAMIQHSAGVYVASDRVTVVSAVSVAVLLTATIYSAAAADYFTNWVTQNSGGNLNVNSSGNYSPEFMAHWMGN